MVYEMYGYLINNKNTNTERRTTMNLQLTRSKSVKDTNIVIILSGNDANEIEQIEKEITLATRKMRRKHDIGYAIVKTERKTNRLLEICKYLFDLG